MFALVAIVERRGYSQRCLYALLVNDLVKITRTVNYGSRFYSVSLIGLACRIRLTMLSAIALLLIKQERPMSRSPNSLAAPLVLSVPVNACDCLAALSRGVVL